MPPVILGSGYCGNGSTTAVWLDWNYTTNTTASVWPEWTASWTNSQIATIYTVEGVWNDWNIGYQALVETREQQAVRLAAQERAVQEREAITVRARSLLMEHLNAEQRQEYEKSNHFHVRGSRGRRYRIKCGRAHNVYTVNDDGLLIVEHCAHVLENVPNEDNILAQKLLIEHDEDAFLATANQRQLVRQ